MSLSAPPSTGQRPNGTVDAIVVVHNGAAWLAQCLDGLAAQTLPPARLVVVDVASSDTSNAIARAHSGVRRAIPSVEIVRLDGRVPIGRAIDRRHRGAPRRRRRVHELGLGAPRRHRAARQRARAAAPGRAPLEVRRGGRAEDRRLGRPATPRRDGHPDHPHGPPPGLARPRGGRPGPVRPPRGRPRGEHERHARAPLRLRRPRWLRPCVRRARSRSRLRLAGPARRPSRRRRAGGGRARRVRRHRRGATGCPQAA